jgi:hypothetical protein
MNRRGVGIGAIQNKKALDVSLIFVAAWYLSFCRQNSKKRAPNWQVNN